MGQSHGARATTPFSARPSTRIRVGVGRPSSLSGVLTGASSQAAGSLPRVRAAATTLLLLVVLGFSACGDDDDASDATATVDEACEEVSSPEPKQISLEPPPDRPSADKLTAVVDTSCGTFEIVLDAKGNPKTVASFEYLAENGVYDDTLWHRIIPGFLIQGGDFAQTGSSEPGYTVDEPPPDDTAYTRGTVAMGKSPVEPPGRSGSQFFVVTGADAGLPPQYALLGEVSSGLDVVKTIEAFGDPQAGEEGTPLAPVLIDSVTIEGG
jgi:peptidyl-prolyl cis-trans isomerase B (cyclophilin B)